MKRILILSIIVFALVTAAVAADDVSTTPSEAKITSDAAYCSDDLSPELLAKRGCCSWHKGVCGCQNNRVVCCDGTYSPTCTCRGEEVNIPN